METLVTKIPVCNLQKPILYPEGTHLIVADAVFSGVDSHLIAADGVGW